MKINKLSLMPVILILLVLGIVSVSADDKICCYTPTPASCGYNVNTTDCEFFGDVLNEGFSEADRYEDLPCYDKDKNKAHDLCPNFDGVPTSCSDYNNDETGCITDTYCYYCPDNDRCIPNCLDCPEKNYDSAPKDRVCDIGMGAEECLVHTTQLDCVSGNCKWCISDQECRIECLECSDEQVDEDFDGLCDQKFAMLFGYIKPVEEYQQLFNSNLSLERSPAGYYSYIVGDTYKPEGIFYSVQVPIGTHIATMSQVGYDSDTSEQFTLTEGETKELNFTLQRKPDLCYNIWPNPTLTTKPIKCVLGINVTWNNPCDEYVDEYTLYRNDGIIYKGKDSKYVDYGILWDTDYDYKIEVTFNNGLKNSTTTTSSPGNSQCEDICDEEWFCFNDTTRGQCDENNIFSSQTCTDGFCWPKTKQCELFDECEETGLPENILGMFYYDFLLDQEDHCYGTSTAPRYCYYDYSETIVDTCQRCSSDMGCYDYRSQTACEKDNCFVAEEECKFTDQTYYYELGIGLCYDEAYEDTDQCSLCSSSPEIFYNAGCIPEVCDLLGACYSDKPQENCIECRFPKSPEHPDGYGYDENPTVCTDYNDAYSCTRGQPFSIDPLGHITPSDDICGIGVCEWVNEECRKVSYNPEHCGDGICTGTETCSSCAVDCGNCDDPTYCGDGSCNGNEGCASCPADCGICTEEYCGDGICTGTETCSSCAVDCGNCDDPTYCGDGSCNGNEGCASCPADCGECQKYCEPCYDFAEGTQEREDCERDVFPPITTIDLETKQSYVNCEGYELSITVTDEGSGQYTTFHCVDQDNSCYPNTPVQNKIPLNGQTPGLENFEGTAYLRYFSIDGYCNQEDVKSETLDEVDTIKPVIQITHSLEEKVDETADLVLDISVSEHVTCTDVLLKHGPETTQSKLEDYEIDDELTLKYTGLDYGYYKYTLTCIDDYNNINITEIDNIQVRKHEIYDVYPIGEHYNEQEIAGGVEIGFKTSILSDYSCTYDDGTNKRNFEQPTPSGEDKIYSAIIPGSEISVPGPYSYLIECYEDTTLIDYTTASFIYDTQEPETLLYYSDIINPIWPDDYNKFINQSATYGNITIALHCNDTTFGLPKQQPNCQKITYCMWEGIPNCNPTAVADGDLFEYELWLHGSNTYFINAYSTDLVGINSGTYSYNVTIDVDGPGGTIIVE